VKRSTKLLAYGLLVGFLLLLVLKTLSVYTDYLWFGEMGQTAVWGKVWSARLAIGSLLAVIFFGWIYPNVRLARRSSAEGITFVGRRLLPEAERTSIEQHADRALLLFAAVGSLLVLVVSSSYWLQWIWFRHAQSFGERDPVFGKDLGFYLFRLPLIEQLWRTAFYFVAIALVATVLVYLYEECIRIAGGLVQSTPKARYHCLGLLALALLLKTYGYRLAMYKTLTAYTGTVPGGASYIHLHYTIPAYWVMIAACVVGAGVCLWGARTGNLRLPGYAVAGLILLSLLGTMAFPSIMRKVRVVPQELVLEQPYIARHIAATSKAFGLDGQRVKLYRDFQVKTANEALTREHIDRNWDIISNIRVWDDLPLEVTYTMQQALRRYYEFANVDVDRYVVDGQLRQVVLSGRQLKLEESKQEGLVWSWVARHLQYTHGYGLCVSPISEVTDQGLPIYWLKDFPPVGNKALAVDARYAGIYFPENVTRELLPYGEAPRAPAARPGPGGPGGPEAAPAVPGDESRPTSDVRTGVREQTPRRQAQSVGNDYVIVGTDTDEIDYPTGDTEGDVHPTRYDGRGGVRIGGLFRRLAFTARFMDLPILLSSLRPDSRIIFNRLVPDRLLELTRGTLVSDPDPYLVIEGGRLHWIADMYTWAARYPYSASIPPASINYVRNSVKAVVDCYDGTTKLYVWDEQDPVLKCYREAFPTLFTRREEMPAGLLKHVRYPMGLFAMQASLYGRYHQQDPRTFFSSEDWWAPPREVYEDRSDRIVAPYYVMLRLPGERKLEMVLMQPFAVRGRENRNMAAWMCARCDPEHYGELLVYAFPKARLPDGPMMIEARISQDPDISERITLWGQQQSVVKRGHLLVLPIEDSLLYVEPLYVESQRNPVPELRLVSVAYGQDRLEWANTLDGALEKLFGKGEPGETTPQPAETPGALVIPSSSIVGELIQSALQAMDEAQRALDTGDLGTYQRRNRDAKQYIEQAQTSLQQ